MTQIDIKRLDSLSHNDNAATKLINDNFQAVKKALEDSLSRMPGSVNYMDTELDMNTRRIINTAEPVANGDVINKEYFDKNVGNAKESADEAKAAADRANSSAISAAIANTNAQAASNDVKKYGEAALEVKDMIQYRPYIVSYMPIRDNWETISAESAEVLTGSKDFIESCTVLEINTDVPYSHKDNWTADVTLSSDLAMSGNFAPVCTVDAGRSIDGFVNISIKIYAKSRYVSDLNIEKQLYDIRNVTVYFSKGV